jgi:hypothetical protein
VQAPTLIGSQGCLAERAEIVRPSLGVSDSRRLSAHALASPRGGRKICVGSSSCARFGASASEAGGEAADLVSAGEGEEVLTATAGMVVGLAATGGAVGFGGGAEGIAGVGEGEGAGVAIWAGDGAGAEAAAEAGALVAGGVASGACTGAGAACAWGAIGAVEIGRSALAAKDRPQPGQKQSSLP